MRILRSVALAALILSASACDDKATSDNSASGTPVSERADSASTSLAVDAAPSPPAAPTKPQLAADDTAVFVAGQRVDVAAPDLKGRIGSVLSDKPVAGEDLVLNASRETKMPKLTALFGALAAKKAKNVVVHTPRRDRSEGELTFTLSQKGADCSAVGFIAKESAINVWPASGAPAERFNRGMAGPDMTRGSEGLRKRTLACDSPVFYVSADDNVTWGLVFDLTEATLSANDAGLPKPRTPALLVTTPVPGHKVETD